MKSGNLNFLEPSGPLQTCNGTALPFILHEDLRTFMIVYRLIPRRMRNISDNVVEKIKTHVVFNNTFPKTVSFVGKCTKM
jgi:hypothetical protein